jgi:SAM-dependent methyltransferase
MQRDVIVQEFTHQARTFDGAAVFHAAETLGALIDLAVSSTAGRWVDLACGTGVVTRALAPKVSAVLGVDVTGAMLEVARAESRRAGLANVRFELRDAADCRLPDASFDGAITRFSLHHIPVPGRVIAEMARVVRSGGWVIAGDHVTDGDGAAAAWHQEIERLRDPSHWSCLTATGIRALGEAAGLELDGQLLNTFELDFDDWLSRSSASAAEAALISTCLAQRPGGTDSFRVVASPQGRRLRLRYALTRWRRP